MKFNNETLKAAVEEWNEIILKKQSTNGTDSQ